MKNEEPIFKWWREPSRSELQNEIYRLRTMMLVVGVVAVCCWMTAIIFFCHLIFSR